MMIEFIRDWKNRKAGDRVDMDRGIADSLICHGRAIPIEWPEELLSARARGRLATNGHMQYQTAMQTPTMEKRRRGRPRKNREVMA